MVLIWRFVVDTNLNEKKVKQNNWIMALKVHWGSNKEEDKAVDYYVKVMTTAEVKSKLHLDAINKLLHYRVYEETKVHLLEIITIQNNSDDLGELYYLLARCNYGLGFLEEATNNLERAQYYHYDTNKVLVLLADVRLELGEWEGAVDCLNKMLRTAPGDDKILYRLGSIYLLYGEYQEAYECFDGCTSLKPLNAEYWEMKAEMQIKLVRLSAATLSLEKAIKLHENCHLLSRLAYCYSINGQYMKSKKLFERILKRDPENFEALFDLAGIYHKIGNNTVSYKLLKKAYSINKNDPILLNNIGYISFKEGRVRKAIDYYQLALKINPKDTNILYNLAVCFDGKGQWEQACNTLESLLSIEKKHSDGWALLGNIYEKMTKYQQAIDCYNKSLGLA